MSGSSKKGYKIKESDYEEIFQTLRDAFPDCDPDFIEYCISHYYLDEKNQNAKKGVANDIAIKLADFKFYPKQKVSESLEDLTEGASRSKRVKKDKKKDNAEKFNTFLETLYQLFPGCDLKILKKEIEAASYRSVDYIAQTLLEKGFHPGPRRVFESKLSPSDMFRSKKYIEACQKQLLNNDFPMMWESSVLNVMTETNNDYLSSFHILSGINSHFQRSFMGKFFTSLNWKRKRVVFEMETTDPQFWNDLAQRKKMEQNKIEILDYEMAKEINEKEYEEKGQLISCSCCFGDYAFEDICHCQDGHIYCRGCIQKFVEGLLFEGNFKELECFSNENCKATFSPYQLKQVLNEETFEQYTNQLGFFQVQRANLELISCPFCNYCEVSEKPAPPVIKKKSRFNFRKILLWSLIFGFFYYYGYSDFMYLPFAGLLYTIQTTLMPSQRNSRTESSKVEDEFGCKNPKCGRVSCVACKTESHLPFTCIEAKRKNPSKDMEALRLYIENAMAEAVMRICPECKIPFVKQDGCNKMTCPRCNYILCYICRQDIRVEKYAHFCGHFREVPGACSQCNKCDLWVADDDKQTKEAGKRALKQFVKDNPNFEVKRELLPKFLFE